MSTTSSSSAGGGDPEFLYLTKAQVEEAIEALDIAKGHTDDSKRMAMAAATQLSKEKTTLRIISDYLAECSGVCNS